jgi:hypothetical protein
VYKFVVLIARNQIFRKPKGPVRKFGVFYYVCCMDSHINIITEDGSKFTVYDSLYVGSANVERIEDYIRDYKDYNLDFYVTHALKCFKDRVSVLEGSKYKYEQKELAALKKIVSFLEKQDESHIVSVGYGYDAKKLPAQMEWVSVREMENAKKVADTFGVQ